jgi:hypothetical protein
MQAACRRQVSLRDLMLLLLMTTASLPLVLPLQAEGGIAVWPQHERLRAAAQWTDHHRQRSKGDCPTMI